VTFKVIQGLWQWCHSICHIRFPVSLPLQLCLYYTDSEILSLITQTLKRSRNPVRIHWGLMYHVRASTPQYHLAHELWSSKLHSFKTYDWEPKWNKWVTWTSSNISLSASNFTHSISRSLSFSAVSNSLC